MPPSAKRQRWFSAEHFENLVDFFKMVELGQAILKMGGDVRDF
jgi:hypothetical protein